MLFATPLLRNLGRAVVGSSDSIDRRLYRWQVGRFFRDAEVRDEVLPTLYADFRPARPAFWRLNADLYGATLVRRLRERQLREFDRPVKIIFGDADPYLNRRVARRFHRLFPRSALHLLPGARHYVQIDEPVEVARLILAPSAADKLG